MLANGYFYLNRKIHQKIQRQSKTVAELINLEEDENLERKSGGKM